jgi:hypothetical protein
MDDHELRDWRRSVEASIAALLSDFESLMGYPPGSNYLSAPAPPDDVTALSIALDGRMPDSLRRFYTSIGALHLPDFWNALFLNPPSQVLAGRTADEVPRRITGAYDMDVLAVGEDGSGTRFAVGLPDGGPIFRLPLSGTEKGLFETEDTWGFRRVADDLPGFLRLVDRELHEWVTEQHAPSFF